MSERLIRCRLALVTALLSFVGLGPDPGQDKEGYKDRVWPNDNEFNKKEMAFGERNGVINLKIRQSSCAIVYEQASREAGFSWPMTWNGKEIDDALKLSFFQRLNKFSPPLYPVAMANDFFEENQSRVSFVQRRDFSKDGDIMDLINGIFASGNAIVQGLKAGGPPGSIWGKNYRVDEHLQGMLSVDDINIDQAEIDEDGRFLGGYIFVHVTVVEGGMPGVEKNERVFVLCAKRGEIWACKNMVDATPEVDWRPRRGRRVCYAHLLQGVERWWTDQRGDVSPTGTPTLEEEVPPDSEPAPSEKTAEGLSPCSQSKRSSRSRLPTNSKVSRRDTSVRGTMATTTP